MVDIHLPFSMSSMLVSNEYLMSRPVPHLRPPRDAMPRDRNSFFPKDSTRHDSLAHWIQTSATVNDYQKASPQSFGRANFDPGVGPLVGGIPYKSVPALRQSTVPSSTSLSTVASAKYVSKAPPLLETGQATKRSNSPVLRKEAAVSREQSRTRSSNESNHIVSYLQIPATINDSKGSLAEFAAQVRLASNGQ